MRAAGAENARGRPSRGRPSRGRPSFGNQSAEDKYEILLRFQAASDEFYCQKRASSKSEHE